jgi:hypothetical protein
MTPVSPTPELDPIAAQKALSIIEFGAKFAIALGAVYAFIEKLAKPYAEHRRIRLATVIREVLKEEIDSLHDIRDERDDLRRLVEAVLDRQTALFDDIDLFIDIARDNRERHDETADLLNAIGLSTDRRADPDRRKEVDTMLILLDDRRKERRRTNDIVRNLQTEREERERKTRRASRDD